MSILWRPSLFSVTGASFLSDATVKDGVHLRWMVDPRLGIPLERMQKPWGGFEIYEQQSKLPSLEKATLTDVRSATSIPVHSEADNHPDHRIERVDDSLHFLHKVAQPASLAAMRILNQISSMNHFLVLEDDKPFLQYIGDLAKTIKGKSPFLQFSFQRAEACAVEITFALGAGTVPGEEPSQNSGCMGIFNALAEKRYARVRAYDQQNNLLVEDWIGRYAFNASHINNPASRNKFFVRFCAPGIYRVAIEPIAGQPVMNRTAMQWVLCEEYCNAAVWKKISPAPIRFKGDMSSYSESILKDHYYKPFQKIFDWNQVLSTWANSVMLTPEMDSFLQSTDTFQMFSNGVAMDTVITNPISEVTGMRGMSMLVMMLQSAVDPAISSLLGLYAHMSSQSEPRDIRVVADLPFFQGDNLAQLHLMFEKLMVTNGAPFMIEHHLGLFDAERRYKVQLGGIVLAPPSGPKEGPPAPNPMTTEVSSMDLPLEDQTVSLFVQGQLKITKPAFSMFPYKTVQAYEVERSIGGEPFGNTVTDEEAFEQIGILPGVHFARPIEGEDTFIIRDSFSLSVPTAVDTLQYRARSFDVFGRPSHLADGVVTGIPFPCHPPGAPSILTARIIVQDNVAWFEILVLVTNERRPLYAIAEKLEIATHALGADEAGSVQDIRWPGNRSGRGLDFFYDTSNHYPDLNTLNISCLNLNWSVDVLNWNVAPPSSCDSVFSPIAPVVAEIPNPSTVEVASNIKTYKIQIAVADLSTLAEGDHTWACRARVKGQCSDGPLKYSAESTIRVSYKMVLPPPPVIQPTGSIIAESTFPDKRGDSYFNVLLNQFVEPVLPGSTKLLNMYKVKLENLQPDIATLVDGNLLLPGAIEIIRGIAAARRNLFKKINEVPMEVFTRTTHYPLRVEGDLENYYVLGIVGTNSDAQESSWDHAAFILFKTPKPVVKPTLRFSGIRSVIEDNAVVCEVAFTSDMKVDPAVTDLPVILVKRYDLNTGAIRSMGETPGIALGEFYGFVFKDLQAVSWRSYRYEATLLTLSGGKRVIAEQRAKGDTVAPGLPSAIPLDNSFAASLSQNAAGNVLTVEFMIGDFECSVTRLRPDDSRLRFEGEIRNGELIGIENASISINPARTHYRLVWTDPDGGAAEYSFRIGRGQQKRWSIKLETP